MSGVFARYGSVPCQAIYIHTFGVHPYGKSIGHTDTFFCCPWYLTTILPDVYELECCLVDSQPRLMLSLHHDLEPAGQRSRGPKTP